MSLLRAKRSVEAGSAERVWALLERSTAAKIWPRAWFVAYVPFVPLDGEKIDAHHLIAGRKVPTLECVVLVCHHQNHARGVVMPAGTSLWEQSNHA